MVLLYTYICKPSVIYMRLQHAVSVIKMQFMRLQHAVYISRCEFVVELKLF